MKKTGLILLAAIVMATLVACGGRSGAAGEKVVFRLAHNAAPGQPVDTGSDLIASLVDERTNGRIEIQVFGNNLLGGEVAQRDMLKEGTLDMGAIGFGAFLGWYPAFTLPMVAFTFQTADECVALFESPEFGRKFILDPLLRDHNIRLLNQWKQSDRHLMSRPPVRSPADFRGLKLRMPAGQNSREQGWDDMGVLALSLSLDEAFTAIEQGVCDAIEMPVDFLFGYRIHEIIKNLTLTSHRIYTQWLVINENSWQGLPAGDQNILRDAVLEAGEKANEQRLSDEGRIMRDFEGAGVAIHRFTNAQYAELVRTVSVAYERNKALTGEEVFDGFIAAMQRIRPQ